MSSVFILQVVGYSKSGKTTIIEQLVNSLKKKGKSVFTIKSARNHPYESSFKDSDKFLRSGAHMSAVVFNDVTQISINYPLSVDMLIDFSKDKKNIDLIILEGFKDLLFPKILIFDKDIPNESELDYSTIRYLYNPRSLILKENSTLWNLLKNGKIILVNNVEELIHNILPELKR